MGECSNEHMVTTARVIAIFFAVGIIIIAFLRLIEDNESMTAS